MKTRQLFLTLLFAMFGGFLASFIFAKNLRPKVQMLQNETQPAQLASYAPDLSGTNIDFTYAAEKTLHAVVHVKVKSMQNVYSPGGSMFDFFFGYRDIQQQPVEGFGSGVIISTDGYIITNNHVIKGADDIEVTLNDKRAFPAKVIGSDPNTDLALLKVDEKDLPVIPYGDSDALKVGEWVLAVGNPYNMTSTVTAGIVSAKSRQLGIIRTDDDERGNSPQYRIPGQSSSRNATSLGIESFIQTDAAVNPGNSGGALVNVRGELVGINTAIVSRTGSYSGSSFAVPTSIVRKVISDLIEFGTVQRAYLGITMLSVTSDLAKEYGLERIRGVYIEEIIRGSAAEKAGLKKGDVITAVNEVQVNSGAEIQEQISRFRPNDKVRIDYVRNKKADNVTVSLSDRNSVAGFLPAPTEDMQLGAEFSPVSEQLMSRLRISNGVQITSLSQGIFRSAGIQSGFIILRIDRKEVRSETDVRALLKDASGAVLLEGIYPNGIKAAYALQF